MSRSNPQLGLFGGLVLLATSLLGSSVFVVPVLGVQIAGQSSLISWLILIAFMVPMAMVFGQLGRNYPHAGGVSHWTARALGPRAEWVIAMVLISVIPVGLPAALLLTMIFLERLIEIPQPWDLVAQLCVLAAVYSLNRAGVRASAWVQTAIILGSLTFIAVLAFSTPIQTHASLPKLGPIAPIAQAAGLMLWCFLGLEIVANLAEEFRNPNVISLGSWSVALFWPAWSITSARPPYCRQTSSRLSRMRCCNWRLIASGLSACSYCLCLDF